VPQVELRFPALLVELTLHHSLRFVELRPIPRVQVDRLAFVAHDHPLVESGLEVVLQLRRPQVVGDLAGYPGIVEVDLQAPVVVHGRKPIARL
jgi:hypothetical protein